jgi:hypothetical protein
MAALGQVVTVADTATLIFMVVDGVTYAQEGYTPTDNPNIFLSGDDNAPLPLLLLFPNSGTVFLGGSDVTASGSDVGASLSGAVVPSLAYNCVGGDSLYGIVASSTYAIQLLALRQ